MNFRIFSIAVFVCCAAFSNPSVACEEYKSLSKDEIKDYRNKLVEEGADEVDRMFSFRELVCSDSPTMRAYAVEFGLKSTSDDVMRNEVMLAAMFQKKRIDINLVNSNSLGESEKNFVDSLGGVATYVLGQKFISEGCINIANTSNDKCNPWRSFIVSGSKILLTDGDSYVAEFELSKSNDVIGFFQRIGRGESKIVASFTLF